MRIPTIDHRPQTCDEWLEYWKRDFSSGTITFDGVVRQITDFEQLELECELAEMDAADDHWRDQDEAAAAFAKAHPTLSRVKSKLSAMRRKRQLRRSKVNLNGVAVLNLEHKR